MLKRILTVQNIHCGYLQGSNCSQMLIVFVCDSDLGDGPVGVLHLHHHHRDIPGHNRGCEVDGSGRRSLG